MAERKWYKGDTHLHTLNSDGDLTKGQLVDRCRAAGLDFMIITDHNYSSVEHSYFDSDMLIIPGEEITGENGHVNIWGEKVPVEKPYKLETKEDYAKIIEECKKAGAVVCLNHPFCSKCGFRFDIDDLYCDCAEVWNTVQHSDNMKNRDWWVRQLLMGKKIAAVGGSDYHRDYAGLNIIAIPTTIVYAEDKTSEAILKALKEGRSVITNSPNSTMIELNCGDAVIGDTVKFKKGIEVQVTITKLPAFHTVKVYNNEEIIYASKADVKTDIMAFSCEVKNKGFVRVEVTYEFKGPLKSLYYTVEKKFLGSKNSSDLPPFIKAFTNPIWFE